MAVTRRPPAGAARRAGAATRRAPTTGRGAPAAGPREVGAREAAERRACMEAGWEGLSRVALVSTV